ncbi:hypothetical protein MMPV_005021 [Pyropia vietnamensis]
MTTRLAILVVTAAVAAAAAPRTPSTTAVSVRALSPAADAAARRRMALDTVGTEASPAYRAPPLSLPTTARVLTPPDLRGTYSVVFSLNGSDAPCPESFTISRGAPVVDAVDEVVAQRFHGSDLTVDGAACGTGGSVVAVQTRSAHSVAVMESLGMPNGTRLLRASDLVAQLVDWASVVGFNVGTLSCGWTAPWNAQTLALWGDAAVDLIVQNPEVEDPEVQLVHLEAGRRHLVFMLPRTPLCILSANPLPTADPAAGSGGGVTGDSSSDGGLSPGAAAAVAAGVVGATSIAAAVAVWEYWRRRRWRRERAGVGNDECPPVEATWAGAPPPPPPLLATADRSCSPPPLPAAAYPLPSSWDDDTRRSSSVPTSAAFGSRPSSSTTTQRDSSTGSGAPPSSRDSGSSGSGGGGRGGSGGGAGAGRVSPAYSDVSSGRTPGDTASSVAAAAATSPALMDDLWPTWDSKLSDE